MCPRMCAARCDAVSLCHVLQRGVEASGVHWGWLSAAKRAFSRGMMRLRTSMEGRPPNGGHQTQGIVRCTPPPWLPLNNLNWGGSEFHKYMCGVMFMCMHKYMWPCCRKKLTFIKVTFGFVPFGPAKTPAHKTSPLETTHSSQSIPNDTNACHFVAPTLYLSKYFWVAQEDSLATMSTSADPKKSCLCPLLDMDRDLGESQICHNVPTRHPRRGEGHPPCASMLASPGAPQTAAVVKEALHLPLHLVLRQPQRLLLLHRPPAVGRRLVHLAAGAQPLPTKPQAKPRPPNFHAQ